ncbi:hypothetical protein H0H10_23965, partial [Streptomyces sp. TRM S81-3]|nr:hypothetical protein [Streptomyces griseicoloratus]
DKGHGYSKGDHGKPWGGVHTGGGALASVNQDDWGGSGKGDSGSGYKDSGYGYKDSGSGYKDDSGKGSWGGSDHEKPRGGMHTGGGALAATPAVTAGGLAALAVAGTGLYAVRRKKTAPGTV